MGWVRSVRLGGFAGVATGIFTTGEFTDAKFAPYVSIRDNAEKHDLRFVILANVEQMKDIDSINVNIVFKKDGSAFKSRVIGFADSTEVYEVICAGGSKYFAADGCAYFGVVVLDIDDGAWDSVELIITDGTGAEIIPSASIDYTTIVG